VGYFKKIYFILFFNSLRDILKSETIRHLSKDTVVICDGLNYVKGKNKKAKQHQEIRQLLHLLSFKGIDTSFIVPANRIKQPIA